MQGPRQQFQLMCYQIYLSPLKNDNLTEKAKIMRFAPNWYENAISWMTILVHIRIRVANSLFSMHWVINFDKNWWVPGTNFSKSMGLKEPKNLWLRGPICQWLKKNKESKGKSLEKNRGARLTDLALFLIMAVSQKKNFKHHFQWDCVNLILNAKIKSCLK